MNHDGKSRKERPIPDINLNIYRRLVRSSMDGNVASWLQCRFFPGDACWSSSEEWELLNKIVGSRLIATVSIAGPYLCTLCC
ncbi:hypothetical protein F4805DRAFT_241321 [Annulohypoxylon moriforme]|nr:hypothetical protein F4805DRAFT_241321 [Annulohypoxylon moriforme]